MNSFYTPPAQSAQPVPAATGTTEPNELAQQVLIAKTQLAIAKQSLLEAEDALVSFVGAEKEGAFSIKTERFKITTTGKIGRTVNKTLVFSLQPDLSPDIFNALFEFKPALNTKFFKELAQHNPVAYATACKAVTAKPGKTTVSVEVIS